MQKRISKEVQFKEGSGFIHGFTTGMVSVKTKFREAQGGTIISKLNFLLDPTFTEWMPIWVWVIDHPEGVFVIDTGENAKVNSPGYFKKEGMILNYINTKSFKFLIEKEEEVGPQLKALGYSLDDISKVILTHLHLDHFDGLSYFENTPVLVNKYEWEHPSSALPSLYPEWFAPTLLDLKDEKHLPFEKSISITQSGEIQMISTPGHTKGHCSVFIKTSELNYLFAGDTSYTQDQLIHERMAGANQDFRLAKKTLKDIKCLATKESLIYLPSHDSQALGRLEKNEIVTF